MSNVRRQNPIVSLDSVGFEIIENVLSAQEAAQFLSLLNSLKVEPLRGGIRRIEQLVPEVAI